MANPFSRPLFLASVWDAGEIAAEHRRNIAAFAGRSNAGKSSLINALCGAQIAKVSRAPGKTRMINVFQTRARVFADLPGYGYAKVAKSESRSWPPKMRRFLAAPEVCALALAVDCRRGLGDADRDMLRCCAHLPQIVIALTKSDKLSRARLAAAEKKAREDACIFAGENGCAAEIQIITVSAKKGANISKLRAILSAQER